MMTRALCSLLFTPILLASRSSLSPVVLPGPHDFVPTDVSVSPTGRVFAICGNTRRVLELDAASRWSVVYRAERASRPRRVCATETHLLVLDAGEHRLLRIDLRTRELEVVLGDGRPGASGLRLSHPGGMCLDSRGNIWVADTGNGRVLRIDGRTSRVTRRISAAQFRAAKFPFAMPGDVAVDGAGTLFVSDVVRRAVLRQEREGGALAVVDGSSSATPSRRRGRLALRRRIALAPNGDLLLVEPTHRRIRRCTGSGTLETIVDGSRFVAITFAGEGVFFVADAESRRVVRYSNGGERTVWLASERRRRASLEHLDGKRRVLHVATGIELVRVPAGRFVRGAGPGDVDVRGDAHPAHPVTISKPFYIGRFEVTNEQYRRFDPLHVSLPTPNELAEFGDLSFDGAKQPVVNVTWFDAAEFCERHGLRLPTEAEWEYACRAGTETPWAWGVQRDAARGFANVANASLRRRATREVHAFPFEDGFLVTAPVGSFRPNGFGLFDMIGNAWEWCADWHGKDTYADCANGVTDPRGPAAGAQRVLRGGSWRCNFRGSTRLSFRGQTRPDARFTLQRGFRVVLDVAQ